MRADALLASVAIAACGSDPPPGPAADELMVGVHTLVPEAGQARVVLSSIYFDPTVITDPPTRVGANGKLLVRRNPITGMTTWVFPGPLTADFDLPAGDYVFSLHTAAGALLEESAPIPLGGGSAAQVLFHGRPQNIHTFDLPAVALADIAADKDLVRLINLTATPMRVMRCAGVDCVPSGVALQMLERHEELVELGSSLRLEIPIEDRAPFVPVSARAEHGGHLVAGVALLDAPPPRDCTYFCATGVVRTSFVAEGALDPRQ